MSFLKNFVSDFVKTLIIVLPLYMTKITVKCLKETVVFKLQTSFSIFFM